jgi:hypothetical protein
MVFRPDVGSNLNPYAHVLPTEQAAAHVATATPSAPPVSRST